MVEVIHQHDATPANNGGNSMGAMLGVLLAVALIFFLFYYFGRGSINGGSTSSTTPQLNVPGKINVDINSR